MQKSHSPAHFVLGFFFTHTKAHLDACIHLNVEQMPSSPVLEEAEERRSATTAQQGWCLLLI